MWSLLDVATDKRRHCVKFIQACQLSCVFLWTPPKSNLGGRSALRARRTLALIGGTRQAATLCLRLFLTLERQRNDAGSCPLGWIRRNYKKWRLSHGGRGGSPSIGGRLRLAGNGEEAEEQRCDCCDSAAAASHRDSLNINTKACSKFSKGIANERLSRLAFRESGLDCPFPPPIIGIHTPRD